MKTKKSIETDILREITEQNQFFEDSINSYILKLEYIIKESLKNHFSKYPTHTNIRVNIINLNQIYVEISFYPINDIDDEAIIVRMDFVLQLNIFSSQPITVFTMDRKKVIANSINELVNHIILNTVLSI